MTITFQGQPGGGALAVTHHGRPAGTVLPTGGRFQLYDVDGRFVAEVGSPTALVELIQSRSEQGLT